MSKVRPLFFVFLLVILSTGTQHSFAQKNEIPRQLSSIPTEDISSNKDQFVFSLGFNRLSHDLAEFTPFWSSLELGYHLYVDMPLGREESPSKFSFAVGGGLLWNNHFHNGRFVHDSVGLAFQETPDFGNQDSIRRSKLGVTYYNLPIELRFRSKPSNGGLAFKWAIGWQTGFKLRSYQKEIRQDNGNYKVFRSNRYRDINFLRTGPTARIGIGALNIQGFYSLTGLFKKDRGPAMTPWSVSLFISAF